MTKDELIKRLNEMDVPGDTEVVFPVEFGGLKSIKNVCIKRVHEITDEGRMCRPVTGCDYIDEKDYLCDSEIYDEKTQRVIVVDAN